MPIYEVHHSFPLSHEQKQSLASSICELHCKAFKTPSFFVHTRFASHDASDRAYFVAGKPRIDCTNRIMAWVRTSSARSKADFDNLAAQIEEAWYDAVKGAKETEGKNAGKRPGEADETESKASAERLLAIAFTPLLAAREAGMTIPEAGQEGAWFKEQMPYFKQMADSKGRQEFKDMLAELEERQDLKQLMA